MTKKKEFTLVDIMADTIGLQFNGVDFSDRFSSEAMQNRMFGVMHSKENNWAEGLYEVFLQQKSENPNLSAHDFLRNIKMGKDFDTALSGIVNLETLGNVFDTFSEARGTGVVTSFLCSAKTKKVAADADLAYFYMDQVSQLISRDESLRENYANMDTAGRQTMIMACLKSLKVKGALDNPTPKQLKVAQARWRPVYRKSADEGVLLGMRDQGIDITDRESFMYKFAASMSEVIRKDDTRLLADRRVLRDLEEPMVDFDKNPDKFSGDDEMDFVEREEKPRDENLIEFGKLYPREVPPYKIQKKLQPFNTKAALKFIDVLLDAFQNAQVASPYANKGNVKVRKPSSPTMLR